MKKREVIKAHINAAHVAADAILYGAEEAGTFKSRIEAATSIVSEVAVIVSDVLTQIIPAREDIDTWRHVGKIADEIAARAKEMADEKGFCEKAEDEVSLNGAADGLGLPMLWSRWVHVSNSDVCTITGFVDIGDGEMLTYHNDGDSGPDCIIGVERFLRNFRPAKPDKRHDRWINCYGDGSMTVHENGREAHEQSPADSRGGIVECRHVTWTTKGE